MRVDWKPSRMGFVVNGPGLIARAFSFCVRIRTLYENGHLSWDKRQKGILSQENSLPGKRFFMSFTETFMSFPGSGTTIIIVLRSRILHDFSLLQLSHILLINN